MIATSDVIFLNAPYSPMISMIVWHAHYDDSSGSEPYGYIIRMLTTRTPLL